MSDEAEWVVMRDRDALFFHPQLNVACSCIGYLLFAVILYSCTKQRVLWNRMHDVLLILFFAFAADFIQMRMHLFFIFNMARDKWNYWSPLKTTAGACTIGVWVLYLHFMLTHVEAIVSIYRFTVRILGKAVAVSRIYIGLGLVFALQASLLFDTFIYGRTETIPREGEPPFPIFCTKYYVLEDPTLVSKLVTAATMSISPILSMIMMFKKAKRGGRESGVSAFIFLSSTSLAFLVYLYLFARYGNPDKFIPRRYGDFFKMLFLASYTVQYLRFPLLCLAAIIFVGDIRGAVLRLILRTNRKPDGGIIARNGIVNEAFVE